MHPVPAMSADVVWDANSVDKPDALQSSNIVALNPITDGRYLYPSGALVSLNDITAPTDRFWWRMDFVSAPGGVYYYQFHNMYTNLCLSVTGNSTTAGAQLTTQTCSVTNWSQWWRMGNPGIAGNHIVNYYSGQCMDAPVAYPDMNWTGDPIQQWTCGGTSAKNQYWLLHPLGGP
jgi:hypothetical protein